MIVTQTQFPGVPSPIRGKVRDVYDLGETMLIVATDRVSAFDVVLGDPIPDKGRVLTGLSTYWFEVTKDQFPNHLISTDVSEFPEPFCNYGELLDGRAMLVKKGKVVPVECVVRGYLAGSGWADYVKTGKVQGIPLPAGLKESSRLPEPIFTPTTKADKGHDMPMTRQELIDGFGIELADRLEDFSLRLYTAAAKHAEKNGIIIADTKFEFAFIDGELTVVDEIFTPDSSRFWPMDIYTPGQSQPSYDKQFIRDYLEAIGWDKQPPAPPLPADVVNKTRDKYREAFEKITGKALK